VTQPAHRLVAAGIAPLLVGLGLIAGSAWTSPPSLALFLVAGVVAGSGWRTGGRHDHQEHRVQQQHGPVGYTDVVEHQAVRV